MPFLPPNQKHQSNEGIKPDINPTGKPPLEVTPTLPQHLPPATVNFYHGLDLQI